MNVATGDLDGDGVNEIITAPGVGGGPHVRVFDRDGQPIGPGFYAYGQNFAGGVRVATGDLDYDGIDEIITVPQSSGGPHVRVFSAEGELLTEFFAEGFGTTGLFVSSVGTPSQEDRILIGAGAGSRPFVAAFYPDGEFASNPLEVFPSGFRGGVSVGGFEPVRTTGYRNGVVVAAGPGGNPHVRTFTLPGVVDGESTALQPVGSFYAYNEGFSGGVSVAGGTSGFAAPGTIVVGAGPGGGPHIRDLSPTGVPQNFSFYAFGANFPGGINIAVAGPHYPLTP